jgi:hypothetical protein
MPRREFLDRETGLYINGTDSAGRRDTRITSFAQTFAIAYDVAPPGEHARLKAVWLPMIERGHSRFFEDIRPAQDDLAQLAMYSRKYGNSLCHAWAGAAPVMLLSRGVLGVEALEPGYALCQVAPAPSGIASGHGAVPTPRGLIEVEWSNGKAEVTLPAATRARLPDGQVVSGKGRHSFRLTANS